MSVINSQIPKQRVGSSIPFRMRIYNDAVDLGEALINSFLSLTRESQLEKERKIKQIQKYTSITEIVISHTIFN